MLAVLAGDSSFSGIRANPVGLPDIVSAGLSVLPASSHFREHGLLAWPAGFVMVMGALYLMRRGNHLPAALLVIWAHGCHPMAAPVFLTLSRIFRMDLKGRPPILPGLDRRMRSPRDPGGFRLSCSPLFPHGPASWCLCPGWRIPPRHVAFSGTFSVASSILRLCRLISPRPFSSFFRCFSCHSPHWSGFLPWWFLPGTCCSDPRGW